ncbi:glycoside hydrolase family 45 protein [Hyaloscypha variabilis F]|uniref:Cellulase n=1 Tax=Hyaloscypha variabilis (strain UAMH 11265 / GT02V1 / F) TaxID=1149755 RepID=A0A2J6RTY6_HYAVF|nr:glycoside hydrolase family 45 protein [Hyaloscypha variabilis F]
MLLPKTVLLALLPFFLQANAQSSGTGKTTRYWDCCKASCGWTKKITLASGANPVASCGKNDQPLSDYGAKSGCESGGTAYMCSNQSPWAVSDTLAYGFAATTIAGGTESSWCCACYELTFTSAPLVGKKLIVQTTNTGSDLSSNQFDLAIPGGGVGQFNGCTNEWGAPSQGWGQQYGGVSSRSACDSFPAALKAGCYFRFDWFKGADNPAVTFKQVACPAAITAKSGCVRANDAINESPTGPSVTSTWTSGASAATPTSQAVVEREVMEGGVVARSGDDGVGIVGVF